METTDPSGFALYDRRSKQVISSHHGQHSLTRALAAAAEHRLTGYLSVVGVDMLGRPITGNLRPYCCTIDESGGQSS